jgi:hypothetical protein
MEKYSIIDLQGYAVAMREGAAKSFAENYSENLDNFISINQVISLIKKHSLGLDEDDHLIITETIFDNIFNEIREWLYGVGLARLASRGYLECAWDEKTNEMVFWLSDKAQTSIPNKPS